MPLYDPVRDPNPSPAREVHEEGLLSRSSSMDGTTDKGASVRSDGYFSSKHQRDGQATWQEEPGLQSPKRARTSIAGILNPSSDDNRMESASRQAAYRGSGIQTTPSGPPGREMYAPPMSAPPTSSSMQFGSPFDTSYSPAQYAREERSPSLHNILNGGEAGPVERRLRDRSRSVSTSNSLPSKITPGPSSAVAPASAPTTAQPPPQFATLLNGPASSSPNAPRAGAEEGARVMTNDGFVVPGLPATRSPENSLTTKTLPATDSPVSSKADSEIVGKSSPSIPQAGAADKPAENDSAKDASVREDAGKEDTEDKAEAKDEEKSKPPEKEAKPKATRRKSSAAGVRRKRDSMIPDDDLVPITGGAPPASKKAKIASPAQEVSPAVKPEVVKAEVPKPEAVVFKAENQEASAKKSEAEALGSETKASASSSPDSKPAQSQGVSPRLPAKPDLSYSHELPGQFDAGRARKSGTRYAPFERKTRPMSVLRPISAVEIEMLKKRHKNPLRTLAERAAGIEPTSIQVEDAGEVAQHYNRREDVGVQKRQQSRIFPLRKFNNWIKSIIIGRYARDRPDPPSENGDGEPSPGRRRLGPRVLELGCGKGGDLSKWNQARASQLVMIDIAAVSIEHAKARFCDSRYSFTAEFFAFDCFSVPLEDEVPKQLLEPTFDNISLQFCMHYAWSDVPKVRIMLENISKYLRKGGVFIGTIPDGERLRQRLKELPEDELTFGNSIYSVTFEQKENYSLFGHKYDFFLDDAVENVPEYVVDWTQLESLAFEYGMRNIYRKNFLDAWEEEKSNPELAKLAERMGVVNRVTKEPELDEEMWEAASIYQAFAFEKIR